MLWIVHKALAHLIIGLNRRQISTLLIISPSSVLVSAIVGPSGRQEFVPSIYSSVAYIAYIAVYSAPITRAVTPPPPVCDAEWLRLICCLEGWVECNAAACVPYFWACGDGTGRAALRGGPGAGGRRRAVGMRGCPLRSQVISPGPGDLRVNRFTMRRNRLASITYVNWLYGPIP